MSLSLVRPCPELLGSAVAVIFFLSNHNFFFGFLAFITIKTKKSKGGGGAAMMSLPLCELILA